MTEALTTIAPAKINLALEVLGRRDDGYHEIRSVMQTIEIVDRLTLEPSSSLSLSVEGSHIASDDDLVLRAAEATAGCHDFTARGSFRLRKKIPAAAGLGGGSSDAAAAIRLLYRQYGLEQSPEAMADVAAGVSSDAPFFCYGGTALVSGRGEIVESLPDAVPFWVVVVTPAHSIPDKTARLYASLMPQDFSDGSAASALAEGLRSGEAIRSEDVFNCFDRAAFEAFDGLDVARAALIEAGAEDVHVAGSGPALWALAGTQRKAREIAERADVGSSRVDVARSLAASEATAIGHSLGEISRG